jgi:mannose-6-phosphate isomerase-like protein (cupin superfamily)
MAYTKRNLSEVENMAPKFGMPEGMEARFARGALELETAGISRLKLAPGMRIPFGHRHGEQEEVYVVVAGGGRIKIDDDVVELAQWDALRLPAGAMRQVEAGPEGIEYLAFSPGDAQLARTDAEMVPGWWDDNPS